MCLSQSNSRLLGSFVLDSHIYDTIYDANSKALLKLVVNTLPQVIKFTPPHIRLTLFDVHILSVSSLK